MKPLVSILIPAYNSQDWIRYSLCSALAQTWERIEIIVVDDGSTDQTLAVAREFEADGVRVVTQQNQGAAAARNKAFSLSRGDYIQWLDADDLLAPDKIARQMEALEQCGSWRTVASGAWGQFLYRYQRAEFKPTALWRDLSPVEWLTLKMGNNLHQQPATWLVTRELTEAAGPWDTSLLVDDDGEYFCRVLLSSDGIRFVSAARVYYRASGTSSLSYIGHSDRKLESQWRSMNLHIAYLRSLEDSPQVRAACVKYLQNWLMYFYPERMDIIREARETASKLGGELTTPLLSWKYLWIQAALGRRLAKRAQFVLQGVRWSVLRSWDKALFLIQSRGMDNSPEACLGMKVKKG
jgi:glycosyltransferase involved in cell wall biosynthesis